MKTGIFTFLMFSINCFAQQSNFYKLADKSIFKIIAFDYSDQSISQGSGFFINSSGIGITNLHVLENVDSAYIVTNDGAKYGIVKILDFSSKYDLIKFKVKISISTPISMSAKKAEIGSDVFALGYPCGLEISGSSTLSKGIISAYRQIDSVDYIQTSAQITHGSSGGGLFDLSGKLIGITQGTFASNLEDVHANLYKVIPSKYINVLSKNLNVTFTELKDLNTENNLAVFNFLKDKGDLKSAERLISEMINNDILNARLWNKYANILCKYQLNNKERAFECYKNAITLDPNNIAYYSNYSICCCEYSMPNKSLEILNIVEQPNSNSHFYYAMGYYFVEMKDYLKAIESYEKSIQLFDANFDNIEILRKTFYETAYCYRKTNDYKKSIELCDWLISKFSDYYTPYLLRSQNYYVLGDKIAACNDLDFVIEFGDQLNKNRALNLKKEFCK
jgi:tetratricopeptide (TPR) repeat protein